MNAARVRAILEAHSAGPGHQGFCTKAGVYFEGYYTVDEGTEIIHFTSGGPMGGWERTFTFEEIDLNTLIPPVVTAECRTTRSR